MSKPISFGLSNKSKSVLKAPTAPQPKSETRNSASLSSSARTQRPFANNAKIPKLSSLSDGSDGEDNGPEHEELTGFGSTGAIILKPKVEKPDTVITNAGNSDWRKRGTIIQPGRARSAERGKDAITFEKNESSKVYGLQFAEKSHSAGESNGIASSENDTRSQPEPVKELTEDERALAALLDGGSRQSRSTAIVAVQANDSWSQQISETDSFRNDVLSRPEQSTLEEYATMPVEEFGMAMLRGMGRKRKANGEIIDLDKNTEADKQRKQRKQEGFLGIGARPVKGIDGIELGAWGKSDMRKNNRGEGFFTPVMVEDKRTGERITEEEFERRKTLSEKGGSTNAGHGLHNEQKIIAERSRSHTKTADNLNGSSARKRDRDSQNQDDLTSRSQGNRRKERGHYDDDDVRRHSIQPSKPRRTEHERDEDSSRGREPYHGHDRQRQRHGDRSRDHHRADSNRFRNGDHRHHGSDRGNDRDRDHNFTRDR